VTYWGGLARVVVALVLALFMVQALGTASAAPEPCAQQCEDDGPDGQCAPDCEDCVCCVHARVAVTGRALTPLPIEVCRYRAAIIESCPPEPVCQDIWRVPKPRAA
jgi:hypothetical protein